MSHIQKHDEVFIYLDILIFLLTQVEYTQVFLMSSMRGSVDWYLQNTHILCFLIHPQNIHILCFLFHRQNIHILCFLIHPQHIHILGVWIILKHTFYILYIFLWLRYLKGEVVAVSGVAGEMDQEAFELEAEVAVLTEKMEQLEE